MQKEELIKKLYDLHFQADITVEELVNELKDDYNELVIKPIFKRMEELRKELQEIKKTNYNKKILLDDSYAKSICIRLNELCRVLDLLNYDDAADDNLEKLIESIESEDQNG